MRRINFIPHDLRPKIEISGAFLIVSLFSSLALYVVGILIWNFWTVRQNQVEFARMDQENAELTQKIDKLTIPRKKLKQDESLESMKKVLAKKNYWSVIFKEMIVLVPDGVWLNGITEIKDEAKKITLKMGKPDGGLLMVTGESASQEIIAFFLTSLERSQYFSGVQMKLTEKEPNIHPDRFKFEFVIPIKSLANEGG